MTDNPPIVLRSEVIWTPDDPDEQCPIPMSFGIQRRRAVLLSACLAVAIFHQCSRSKLLLPTVPEIKPMGRDDATSAGDRPIDYALRHVKVSLPRTLDKKLADVDSQLENGDMPYFFHPPRSMGQTIKDILGQCMHLSTTNLTATVDGMHSIKTVGLLKGENKLDFIFTQYLHAGAMLFDRRHRGR